MVFSKLQSWGNAHRLAVIDYVRLLVGLFITYKGILFLINIDELRSLTAEMDVVFASAGLAHYVIFAHLLGGPLLAAGLYTRIMALIQFPVLIGAIFFVNYEEGFMSLGHHMELEIAIGVTVCLIIFMIFGSGRFSIDHMRRKDERKHGH